MFWHENQAPAFSHSIPPPSFQDPRIRAQLRCVNSCAASCMGAHADLTHVVRCVNVKRRYVRCRAFRARVHTQKRILAERAQQTTGDSDHKSAAPFNRTMRTSKAKRKAVRLTLLAKLKPKSRAMAMMALITKAKTVNRAKTKRMP